MGTGNLLKLIGLFLFLTIVFSYNDKWSAQTNNDNVVQNAARNAMTQAINYGSARVTEEVTINKKVAQEAFLRQYAEAENFHEGKRRLNIVDISSKPAMMAVESYNILDNIPLNNLLNVKESVNPRQVELVIFEAKKTTK